MQVVKLGNDFTLKLPEELCRDLNLQVGDSFSVKVEDGGLSIESLVERFTPERIAEFLLNNSVTEQEYRQNLIEVLALGVDPLKINPEYLSRDESWQRAEAHQDILRARRSS